MSMVKHIKEWKIVNIKLHCYIKFRLKKCYCSKEKQNHSRNFCVHKKFNLSSVPKICFTLFKSGFVNICGLKSNKEISLSLDYLTKTIQLQEKLPHKSYPIFKTKNKKTIVIDSITFTGHLKNSISFDFEIADRWIKEINNIFKLDYVSTNFDGLHFPGWFINFKKVSGKILLFRSGKFNIVGVRCLGDFHRILLEMDVFIDVLSKTLTLELLSVLTARWY